MVRTLQKFKKQKNEDNSPKKQVEIAPAITNPPIKARGKTYQNKSSLDNWEQQNTQRNGK